MELIKKKITTNSRVVKDLLTKYKDTFQALTELINNSLQADAKTINLELNYNDDSISKAPFTEIVLSDDGHGVYYANFDDTILQIGTKSKEAGQGIGRFSALQIGDIMKIETIGFDEKTNKKSKTIFQLNSDDLIDAKLTEIEFDVSFDYLKKESKERTGYKVTISNLHHNKQEKIPKRNHIIDGFLEKNIKQAIFEHYPYEVFNKKVEFKVNGEIIDRDDFVIGKPSVKKVDFIDKKGDKYQTSFFFYKIKADFNKVKVYFQTENSGLKSIAHQFSYTSDWYTDDLGTWFIYVESPLLDSDLFRNLDIETLGEQQISAYKNFVKETINDFFKAKNKHYEKFVKTLEKDKAYPKSSNFSSGVQEVIFKKAAYLIENEHQLIKKNSDIRNFLYPLLNRAIADGHIAKIFDEVLKLSPENTEKFHNLLLNTELENVVQFASQVSDKLQFIDFFHELNYGEISKHIKERSVLHKIIENQLWVFGENYNGSPVLWSDKKIGNILTELHTEYFNYEPTKEDKNLIEHEDAAINDITDLFFFNEKITDNGDKEIMIVELKAPKCAISEKEINQINRYAFTIEEKSSLPSNNVKYKLILISSKLTKYAQSQVKSRRQQYDIPFLFDKKTNKNIEVYIMEWSELIDLNRRKLGYLSNHLRVREKDVKETFETEYSELVDTKISAQLRKVG